MWFSKDAVPFLAASVTLGSPSDNTTPRCQMVARGRFFAFTKPSNCCIGCCREGRAGRGAGAACMPTAFFRPHEIFRNPGNGAISTADIRWHLAPQDWPTHQSRSSRPARTARQYPMLNALYISKYTGLNAFVVGVDNLL